MNENSDQLIEAPVQNREATVFRDVLCALVHTGRVRLQGLLPSEPVGDVKIPIVGYVPDPANPRISHLYPDAALFEVNLHLSRQGIGIQQLPVAKQLKALKILTEYDRNRYTRTVLRGKSLVRVWIVDNAMFGLTGKKRPSL